MKGWMKLAVAGMVLCLCAGCVDDTKTITVQGRGAMLLGEATLEDTYTATMTEDRKYHWHELDWYPSFNAGDIVSLLEDEGERSRVMLYGGDVPAAYGYLPSNLLTDDPEALKSGNLAALENAQSYDAPEGNPLFQESGYFKLLQRENGWVKGSLLVGGGPPFWVKEEDLSFDFGGETIDRG